MPIASLCAKRSLRQKSRVRHHMMTASALGGKFPGCIEATAADKSSVVSGLEIQVISPDRGINSLTGTLDGFL
jgi:hypothetical protein